MEYAEFAACCCFSTRTDDALIFCFTVLFFVCGSRFFLCSAVSRSVNFLDHILDSMQQSPENVPHQNAAARIWQSILDSHLSHYRWFNVSDTTALMNRWKNLGVCVPHRRAVSHTVCDASFFWCSVFSLCFPFCLFFFLPQAVQGKWESIRSNLESELRKLARVQLQSSPDNLKISVAEFTELENNLVRDTLALLDKSPFDFSGARIQGAPELYACVCFLFFVSYLLLIASRVVCLFVRFFSFLFLAMLCLSACLLLIQVFER